MLNKDKVFSRLDEIKARVDACGGWQADQCEMKIDPEDGYVFVPQGATLGDTLIQLADTYENSAADWSLCAHAPIDLRDMERLLRALLEEREARDAYIDEIANPKTLVNRLQETYRATEAALAAWEKGKQ